MPRHVRSFRASRGQAGFTLLEVMIAVVILSVGLLGMALLQSTSLRAAQTTNERSQATMLVYEMMDMVRTNRRQASQYGLIRENQFFGDGRTGACAAGAPVPAQRWAADRNDWVCAVRRAIPDARGRVTVTGAVVPVGPGAATHRSPPRMVRSARRRHERYAGIRPALHRGLRRYHQCHRRPQRPVRTKE